MNAAADRLEFAPPPTRGLPRALGLAIIAHMLLVAALTWGVQWKRSADLVSAEAELWSSVPQQAAPKLVEPPPAPAPPKPVPAIAPVAPKAPAPDIALEREKQRLAKEKQQEALKLAQEKRAQQKLALEKKREQDEKLAQEKKKDELEAKQQQAQKVQQDAARLDAQRKANMARLAGLAGSAGGPTATGTALQSSGPSQSYGGRVSAKVKPNIVFIDNPAGNPIAEVEVRAAPDGTIVGRKLIKTSGNRAWDEAVLSAIDKTKTLPRDVDGRVPPVLVISFRPRD